MNLKWVYTIVFVVTVSQRFYLSCTCLKGMAEVPPQIKFSK
jgi:hypothetical protein